MRAGIWCWLRATGGCLPDSAVKQRAVCKLLLPHNKQQAAAACFAGFVCLFAVCGAFLDAVMNNKSGRSKRVGDPRIGISGSFLGHLQRDTADCF